MLRSSLRLLEGNYYTEQGSPSVSYKERLYRVFRRRFSYNRNNQRGDVSSNHQPQDHGDYIAPDYHQLDKQQDVNNHDSMTVTGNNTDTNSSTQDPTTSRTQTLTTKTQTTNSWTTGTEATSTATTGTQTVRPKRKKVKTTRGSSFHFGLPLLLLLAFRFKLQMTEVKQEVQSLRQRLHTVSPLADNIPNFALKSEGASVISSLSSDTYWPNSLGTIMDSIFSWWYTTKRQTGVIRGHSSLHPGDCWPFSGDQGHLFITLSHPVSISHVTLGHITKSQSPSGFIASAPREFSVYGLTTTDEEGTFLGKLVYDQDGAAFLTFQVTNPDKNVFTCVKLQIENNWGNTAFTCLYSFRVHGSVPTQ